MKVVLGRGVCYVNIMEDVMMYEGVLVGMKYIYKCSILLDV